MAAESSFARKTLPLKWRIGAIEHAKDLVFLLEDALQRGRAEDEERLEFAEMQQGHDRIDVGGLQENSGDRGVRGLLIIGRERKGGEDLGSQIGRGPHQEPNLRITGKGDLGLRAGFTVEFAAPQAAAIVTGAVPLWESASGSRAENFDEHSPPGGRN